MSRMIICCAPDTRDLREEFPQFTSLFRIDDGEGGWATVNFSGVAHSVWDTNEAELALSLPVESRVGIRAWMAPNLWNQMPNRLRRWLVDVYRADAPTVPRGEEYWKRYAMCGLTDFFAVINRSTGTPRAALAVSGGSRAQFDPATERLRDRRPAHTWQGINVTPVDAGAGAGFVDATFGSDESVGQDSETAGDVFA